MRYIFDLRNLFVALIVPALPHPAALAQESTSAGGQWVRTQEKGGEAKLDSVSFVLTGDTQDYDRHPSIVVNCADRRNPPDITFQADVGLSGQAHDVYNHYAPSIWVLVKVDDGKVYRALWDLVAKPGVIPKAAVLDRKTVHYLVTGGKMRLRFSDREDESHLDEFTIRGLNVNDVRESCGAKWFGREELSDTSKSARAQHPNE